MELTFSWNAEAEDPRPGQFFTLKASPFTDPLLRRPFAFSGFSEGKAKAIYQVRGPATRMLASMAPDSPLDIIAPLGNGFPIPDISDIPEVPRLLVAGGIGLGPLLFLAEKISAGSAGAFASGLNKAAFVAGFRTASSIPDTAFPEGSILCTDDGSAGYKGSTADFLVAGSWPPGTRLYACGPHPMLAALARMSVRFNWKAFFSVEQWMACGVGACMGCVVKRSDGGYSRACSDGPVFRAEDIDWEETR